MLLPSPGAGGRGQFTFTLRGDAPKPGEFSTADIPEAHKAEARRRFPDVSTKGAVGYGVLRSIQLRWIRLPKAQVKLGQKLPDRY